MNNLVELSDWFEEKVEVGKFKGNIIKTRWVLCLDNWGWIIAEQNEKRIDSPVGQRFHGSLNHIINCDFIKERFEAKELEPLFLKIVTALEKQTGKKYDKEISIAEAKNIDTFFGTSYFKVYPPNVLANLGYKE